MSDIRSEDTRFLKGEGQYCDDLVPGSSLRGFFVRSPHAHARIRSINVDAAMATKGVVVVLTGEDLAAAGLGGIGPNVRRKTADGKPMWLPPRPSLTSDVARFVGDPVVLVVATSRHEAEDGAEAVEIDWEELPNVTDTVAASDPDSPQVWPAVPGNIAYDWQAGDADATSAALANAAHVTELTVRISRTTASPMEPRAVLAEYDTVSKRFCLTAGLQSPWQARKILAEQVLNIPLDALDIVVPDVGGSFGMKGQTFPEFGALLHAARLLRQPVYWLATRSEAMLSDDQGRDVAMTGWLGLDDHGGIVGLKMEGVTALGAYLSTRGTLTTVDNVPGIIGAYRVPAAHARMRGIHTNTPSISPYRGAGRPEASLLIERLVDEAARETGRDPVELRRQNMLTPDELPCETALGFSYDNGEFQVVLDRTLVLADHAGFKDRRITSETKGLLRGMGISSVIARSAAGQFEAARLTLDPDGQLTLASGAVSHGQGHETVFPELAARVLGVAPASVTYASGRSDLFDEAVGTFGSRSAGIAGPAVERAANALIEKLKPEAARLLNAAPEDVGFADGCYSSGDGQKLTIGAIAARLDKPVSAEEKFAPEAATFPNSAHVCEIEVDPATGHIEIVRYTIVEDVGTVLHPAIVKGQVHGGIVQGLGQVMNERISFDSASGQPITGSFMDFAMPRAQDVPAFLVESRPVPTDRNPLGVKGAGEGGTIGALPAFQNALADALAPFGVRDIPMPATSEAVWRLIEDARKNQKPENKTFG